MRFFFIPVQIISLLAEYGIFVGNICLYEARKKLNRWWIRTRSHQSDSLVYELVHIFNNVNIKGARAHNSICVIVFFGPLIGLDHQLKCKFSENQGSLINLTNLKYFAYDFYCEISQFAFIGSNFQYNF